jgi:AraC-like DNA-binding protein
MLVAYRSLHERARPRVTPPPPSPSSGSPLETIPPEPGSGPKLSAAASRRPAPPPALMLRELEGRLALALDHREPTVDEIAADLRVSTRTLQRRLTQAHTTFERELDRAREARARTMVRDGTRLRAVAATLGYAHVRSFLRAFRRWTGLTPSSFRRAAASETDLAPRDLANDAVGDVQLDPTARPVLPSP